MAPEGRDWSLVPSCHLDRVSPDLGHITVLADLGHITLMADIDLGHITSMADIILIDVTGQSVAVGDDAPQGYPLVVNMSEEETRLESTWSSEKGLNLKKNLDLLNSDHWT